MFYLVYLQASAAPPQGGDWIWCSGPAGGVRAPESSAIFRGIQFAEWNERHPFQIPAIVKISGEINRDAGLIPQ